MATYPAIAAISETILDVLRRAAGDHREFEDLELAHYSSGDLQRSLTHGVSLLLHRVTLSQHRRATPPREGPDGTRYRPSLPIDLHYLLTAWAGDAVSQQRLLAWSALVLDGMQILPATLLNRVGPEPDVFRPDETAELVWETVPPQEIAELWDGARANRQPSMTYVVRMVSIDSPVPLAEGRPVQARQFDYERVRA